jgi:hypothetical protein
VSTGLLIGTVVALVLIVVVVIGARRPRSAEDELGQPKLKPASPDIDSSDAMAELKSVLQSIQAGKQTGTLVVTAGRRVGCVYFLYGHLFHAVYGTSTGEVALREMLGWWAVQYAFDTKAPLPKEQTIDRPLDQILSA